MASSVSLTKKTGLVYHCVITVPCPEAPDSRASSPLRRHIRPWLPAASPVPGPLAEGLPRRESEARQPRGDAGLPGSRFRVHDEASGCEPGIRIVCSIIARLPASSMLLTHEDSSIR